ncbi:MAG: single-stranded DNA-binding protein [Sporichthyaceae bacterium]
MDDTWVTISGNVVDMPERRSTSAGMVTKFRLAATATRMRDGQWSDGPTSFYDVSCWNRTGENVAESVYKGQPIVLHGKLTIREWVNEGVRGRAAEISADHIGHDLRWGVSSFQRSGRRVAPVTEPVSERAETGLGADEEAAEAA